MLVTAVMHGHLPSLAGKLSRWLTQVSAGVFVGKVSARVSQEVLGFLKSEKYDSLTWIEATNNEQGFRIQILGEPLYTTEDYDGMPLMIRKKKKDPAPAN